VVQSAKGPLSALSSKENELKNGASNCVVILSFDEELVIIEQQLVSMLN